MGRNKIMREFGINKTGQASNDGMKIQTVIFGGAEDSSHTDSGILLRTGHCHF